jgi:hypothetical protein
MTPVGTNFELPVAVAADLLPPHNKVLLSHPLDAEPAPPLPIVVPFPPVPGIGGSPCEDDRAEFVVVPPHETIRAVTPRSNAIESRFGMFSSPAELLESEISTLGSGNTIVSI